MRTVLERAITDTCSARDWRLIALNVRSLHIHAVVAAEGTPPERVLNAFKAWGTRHLRSQGLLNGTDRFWSRHGSTRYLWTDDDVGAARSYVLHHQGAALEGSEFGAPDFG